MQHSELANLIHAYLNQSASEQQVGTLSEQLARDGSVRRLFWELADVEQLLIEHYEQQAHEQSASNANIEAVLGEMLEYEQQVDPELRRLDEYEWARLVEPEANGSSPSAREPSVQLPDWRPQKLLEVAGIQVVRRPHSSKQRRLGLGRLAWAAGIAIVVGLTAVLMQEQVRVEQPRELATLTDTFAAAWHDAQGQPWTLEAGAELEPGTFELVHGFAQLEMANGTSVLIEGPASFELHERGDMLSLDAGQLVARAGEDARTFTVSTPSASVTDLGTEFGVAVDMYGSTETSVFEGRVELFRFNRSGDRRSRATRHEIRQGQASRVDANSSEPLQMLTIQDVDRRFVRTMPLPFDVQVVQSDPLVYLDFERIEEGRVFSAAERFSAASIHGELHTVDTGFGKAMGFGQENSYLTLDQTARALRGLQTYTIEAYVRPNNRRGGVIVSFQAPMQTGQSRAPTAALLEFRPEVEEWAPEFAARVRYLHRDDPTEMSHDYGSNLITARKYEAGQWYHLVAVKHEDHAVLYVNGQRVAIAHDASPISEIIQALRIGAYDDPDSPRLFNGAICDLAIYRQALTHADVEQRYLALELRGLQSQ